MLIPNLLLMHTGANQVFWIVREAFEKCDDYSCAAKKLTTQTTIAPVYFIMAGVNPYEGMVLTRDRFKVANIRSLTVE